MTDIPLPAPGDSSWSDWGTDEEATSDKIHAATDAATPSTLIMRDAAGRAKVVDGSAASDIATKGQLDAYSPPAASTTVSGVVELATNAEVTTGTDTTRAVTPAGAKVELDKKAPLRLTTTIQTGASYTFAVGDANTCVEGDRATAQTFTVPNAVFTAGDVITFCQVGAGTITIAQGASTTRTGRGSAFTTAGQWAEGTIRFRSSSAYVVSGDLVV